MFIDWICFFVVVKICLDHYEQTMKYGGRKVLPNKAEIELLISVGNFHSRKKNFFYLINLDRRKTSGIFITRWIFHYFSNHTIDGNQLFNFNL
jgi:hypothetical protein